jgi:hypothetical protein
MLTSLRKNEEAPEGTGDPLVDSVDENIRLGRFGGPGRSLDAEFKPPPDY